MKTGRRNSGRYDASRPISTDDRHHSRYTSRPFILSFSFSFILLFLSCGSSSDRFTLEGRFRNLNQGEFYIYNPETGTKDTIHLRDSRFEYERMLDEPTQLVLMFPNYSEMPVFAQPGSSLSMKGDASHLRETEIKGDDVNEEMTEFRLAIKDNTPPEQSREAARYVEQHPESPIALYLVTRYFVQGSTPDYPQAYKLCKLVAGQQPDNLSARRLLHRLEGLKNFTETGKLPRFSVKDTKGQTVDNSWLKADVNVIVVWAVWNFESQNLLRMLRGRQREYGNQRLHVVSISLDASMTDGKRILERDTITWPNVCDGMMWQTSALQQLGFGAVGDNVVVDKKGTIVARNLDNKKLKEKIDSMLKGR